MATDCSPPATTAPPGSGTRPPARRSMPSRDGRRCAGAVDQRRRPAVRGVVAERGRHEGGRGRHRPGRPRDHGGAAADGHHVQPGRGADRGAVERFFLHLGQDRRRRLRYRGPGPTPSNSGARRGVEPRRCFDRHGSGRRGADMGRLHRPAADRTGRSPERGGIHRLEPRPGRPGDGGRRRDRPDVASRRGRRPRDLGVDGAGHARGPGGSCVLARRQALADGQCPCHRRADLGRLGRRQGRGRHPAVRGTHVVRSRLPG